MALIHCPECNKEVSDKAQSCPHCGYPISDLVINTVTENTVKVNGTIYDISKLKKIYDKYTNAEQKMICQTCKNLYKDWYKSAITEKKFIGKGENLIQWIGCTFNWWPNNQMNYIAYKFLSECRAHNFQYFEFNTADYMKPTTQQPINPNIVRCPKCGSTSVTTEERGYDIMWGWIGSSTKKNLCQKCGFKWNPGREGKNYGSY